MIEDLSKMGNSTLTPAARAALRRIHVLREATKRTGLLTTSEQTDVLLSLADDEMLDVSAILSAERGTR